MFCDYNQQYCLFYDIILTYAEHIRYTRLYQNAKRINHKAQRRLGGRRP
jgi:hypothetical protein